MNLKIKRMRELAGFFAQTVRTDGFGPTLKRSAAAKKGVFCPKRKRWRPSARWITARWAGLR